MAERAHPEIDGFSSPWEFRLRRGYIPWVSYKRKPYRSELIQRYKWVNSLCRNKKVLDVPCGMGWGTSLLSKARKRIGIDISIEAIEEAKKRYGKNCEYLVGSMEHLPLEGESVDVIACLEGIEHVSVDIAHSFVSEADRVLRRDGMLMLSSPYCKNGKHSGNPYHIHEYQPEEILSLVGTKFDVKERNERRVENLTILYIMATKK